MSEPDLVFGWRTALLALASVQVLVLAGAIALASRNRAANRRLAALLVVLVGVVTPYTLGFAGFYDAFRWLTLAPFALPLAIGPLALAYVRAWTDAPMRPPLAVHLAPTGLHLAYLAVGFSLPLADKLAFADRVDGPFVAPLVATLTPVSLMAYAVAALRSLRAYRRRLGEVVSDEARFAQGWLGHALVALTATFAVWAGFRLWELAVAPLDYFGRMPLYLLIAALAVYLVVQGWRHADLRRPGLASAAPREGAARNWGALGAQWAERVDAEGWWREPDLSLPDLAARLGTNTHYLSRALNEGLGCNFAAFVNGRRVRAVEVELAAGSRRPVLELALEVGFNSKASFNRAYRAEFGRSPTEARRGSQSKHSPPLAETRRAAS